MNDNLARVSKRLAAGIVSFAKERVNDEFHMEELRAFLKAQDIEFAPASPDRILRALRQAGTVNYDLVNRTRSLYRVTGVSEAA